MTIPLTTERISDVADSLLSQGIQPTLEIVTEKLGLSGFDPLVEEYLQDWWLGLSKRVLLTQDVKDAPDALSRAVKLLWEDAISQAGKLLDAERLNQDKSIQLIQDAEHQLSSSRQSDYDGLEHRYKQEIGRAEDLANQLKVLEAESSVLRSNLTGEVTLRKQTEEALLDSRNEIKRGSRNLEDAKRTFDGRMKDEQTHAQELLAKAEAELRHYRNSLEMVRDETGKKESALTKRIHDLQAEIAKKGVKTEYLIGQAKNVDTVLRAMRTDTESQHRQISQLNAKLLSETNRNKRHEERVKQLEIELKNGQQRLKQCVTDGMRKESDLRQGLKSKDDELLRMQASYGAIEKKFVGQEETIRRLQAQAQALR